MKKLLLILTIIGLLASPQAFAYGKGDMFYNAGFGYERPWVPGDTAYSGDLFHTVAFTSSGKDMFRGLPRPGDIGIEDLFTARVDYVPDTPLYRWPARSNYPYER